MYHTLPFLTITAPPLRPPHANNIPLHTTSKRIRHPSTITSIVIPSCSSIHNISNSKSSFSRFKNLLTFVSVCSSNASLSSVTSPPSRYAATVSPPAVTTIAELPSGSFPAQPLNSTINNNVIKIRYIRFSLVSLLQPVEAQFYDRLKAQILIQDTGYPIMPKPRTKTGAKNLIGLHLKELRKEHQLSQRDLARQLQIAGFDMDKNVITRIETNKRYVTDLELKALTEIFHVSYDYLIDGCEKKRQ